MMAGPSFGSAVAVSQGAGELELGMSDFLGGIFGAWHCCAGAMHHGGRRTALGGRRAAGGGRRTAVGDAPRGRRTASPLRGDVGDGHGWLRGGRSTATPLRYGRAGFQMLRFAQHDSSMSDFAGLRLGGILDASRWHDRLI